VRINDQVNVAMQIGNDFLSIAGTATVSRDQTMIDELWNRYAEAWFEGAGTTRRSPCCTYTPTRPSIGRWTTPSRLP
jgi:Pyridoxamine 5'-phosphate oxidase like